MATSKVWHVHNFQSRLLEQSLQEIKNKEPILLVFWKSKKKNFQQFLRWFLYIRKSISKSRTWYLKKNIVNGMRLLKHHLITSSLCLLTL